MYRDGHIFLYSLRRVGWCILCMGRGFKVFICLQANVPSCHGECFLKSWNCDTCEDTPAPFQIQMAPLEKNKIKNGCDRRDILQCPVALNWQNDETLTEVERGHGTLYSAKLCKYIHTTRSVSKSNILKLNFVNYCTVQDPARNVLSVIIL